MTLARRWVTRFVQVQVQVPVPVPGAATTLVRVPGAGCRVPGAGATVGTGPAAAVSR